MRLTAAINIIQHRMDFYVLLHVHWAIYLLWRQRRRAVAEVWPRYCCFLATAVAFQYLLCLGPSPALCKGLCSAVFRFGELRMQKRPKKAWAKCCREGLEGYCPSSSARGQHVNSKARAGGGIVANSAPHCSLSSHRMLLQEQCQAGERTPPASGCKQPSKPQVTKAVSSRLVFICLTVRKAAISCDLHNNHQNLVMLWKICSLSPFPFKQPPLSLHPKHRHLKRG